MTNTKLTYVSTINAILTAINKQSFEGITAEHVEKLIALGQSLEKRNASKSDKPTKKQTENAEVKDAILSKLSSTEGKRCGDIAAEVGISGQKCSALLSQLVKTGEVVKTEDKRVALFTLPIGG
jgi:predicted Rossmann fold nucleotide-binding protein DprA/Smf involved in DNA uptake